MYTKKNIEDINPKEYEGFKLCYIELISPTIYEVPEEIEKKYEKARLEYGDRYQDFLWDHPKYRCQEMPNPIFERGKHDTLFYFTPIDLNVQWGDDWNDAPYEYNAERPYDTHYENGERIEHNILVVTGSVRSHNIKFPRDWGGSNSPFAVEDINAGCVAWAASWNEKSEPYGKYLTLLAGDSVEKVIDTLNKISEVNPSFDPNEEDLEYWYNR